MAGALDIARHTRRVRQEQHKRNLEAMQEADRRRSEAERLGQMTPGEIRRHTQAGRNVKQMRDAYEDKREKTKAEDKSPPKPTETVEQGIKFASPRAQELADEEFKIPHDVIDEFAPSHADGYTADDIRAIHVTLEEEARKAEADDDEGDDEDAVDDEDAALDEEE